MDFYHFETEADVRKHLGISRSPKLSPYDRAWAMLEAADHKAGKARDIAGYDPARLRADFTKPASQAAADSYARYWTIERIERFRHADRLAKAAALAAVEDVRAVKDARALADKLRDGPDLRAFAKAASARIEMECAVWDEAYGRAMPREFWSES